VNVLEGRNGVCRVPQIPDVEDGVRIVVVGDDKLGRNLGVPHHLGLLGNNWLLCGLFLAVVEVIECAASTLALRWLHELENRFRTSEIPDHDLSILTSTCQNVRHNQVPADRSDG